MLFHFIHGGLDLSFRVHQHHIYISYSTEYMIQQSSQKTLAFLTRRQFLSQKFSIIVISVDIVCPPFVPSSSLPYHVVGNNRTLILQSRFRDAGI